MIKEERIPINPDTGALGGSLEGHSLTKKCNENWDRVDIVRSENADLWEYSSDMPLCGTSGYAVVLGEYVLAYKPICMH